MDLSTLLSVVHTLLAAFDVLKEMGSIGNDGSNLDKLKDVAVTIKNVLLDAEDKYIYDQLPRVIQQSIEELSFALYDADDLLDEFVTLAKQKHLLLEDEFNQEVGLFFSHNDPLGVAGRMSKWVEKIKLWALLFIKKVYLLSVAGRMSQGIDKIKTELDKLQATPDKFGLKGLKRDETCSYPDTEIIGRDEDVEVIVDKLIGRDEDVEKVVHSDVSVLTIVGMGGMGKTALIQCVFNHKEIKTEFSLRVWVCVSDHDQKKLDVKTILAQILESASGQKSNECSMDVVVNRVREVLIGKRFLIVLDDLWTESRNELQKLLGHLVGGKVGSQIVVTTRSNETANIMGKSVHYVLRGLSDVYSWNLFKLFAFTMKEPECPNDSYVDKFKIGKDIIKKCANVPLAIKVVGGLLYGQDKSKWLMVQKIELANLNEDENGITPILKLSYHNLEPPLKSCFSYCSLYPKDYEIEKETLIRLWIAQGYVVSRGNGQSVEDAGEEYFLVLLRRCFFQDVHKNRFGEIHSFKLHDLMHDVALEVSNKDVCLTSSFTGDMDKVVRHVSLTGAPYENFDLINAHVRTILILWNFKYDNMVLPCLEKYRCLRTLNLSRLIIKILPASIEKLIHLRHLDLSDNEIEVLPNSITKLYNLQTLDLSECRRLKELPKSFNNLVNLRVLRLDGCQNLTLMPCNITGMSKLINLDLDIFNVGARHSSLKQQLEAFKALKMVRGHIKIWIHLPSSDVLATEGGYIRDKDNFDRIRFVFLNQESSEGGSDYKEELLGALRPHENLKELELSGYEGVRLPRSWPIEDNFVSVLPNLVQLELSHCCELKCLPLLGNLQNLKELSLRRLPKLEYMETPLEIVSKHGEASGELLQFFPCLEELSLIELPKFKGWGRSEEIGDIPDSHPSSLVFSKLINLDIISCRNLTSLPGCPNVKTLSLTDFNERLRITSNPTSCLLLNEVTIYGAHRLSWLDSSVPIESLESLTKLTIGRDEDVENLVDYGKVFQACSSSLQTLAIDNCRKLRSVLGGLVYLNALESLTLESLPKLNLANEDEEIEGDVECDDMPWSDYEDEEIEGDVECDDMPWSDYEDEEIEGDVECDDMPWGDYEDEEIEGDVECDGIPSGALCDTLSYLEFNSCMELETLPKWMQKLTSLQQLNVYYCPKLKTFPKWMRKLTSLQQLTVYGSSKELYERCQNPNGEDWPNIKHIPSTEFENYAKSFMNAGVDVFE